MNPHDLIDPATGRIIPAQVLRHANKRAAFLASDGLSYRTALSYGLRQNWAVARNYAYYRRLEIENVARPLPYTGGREIDGTMHERCV